MRINRENTIGLVIDMQEKLVPSMNNQKLLVQRSLRLLKGLKLFKIPIVVTQQNSKGLGSTIAEINKAIGNFSYIEKKTFSCYISTDKHCGLCLACKLRQAGFKWANVKDPTNYNIQPSS